mmetsp:Transcript_15284/g.34164  ORF Transcript_15284/g.34164 Transcript_15284/m.34164 type:complete len:202 (-) Transcript_15284:330-935(-)
MSIIVAFGPTAGPRSLGNIRCGTSTGASASAAGVGAVPGRRWNPCGELQFVAEKAILLLEGYVSWAPRTVSVPVYPARRLNRWLGNTPRGWVWSSEILSTSKYRERVTSPPGSACHSFCAVSRKHTTYIPTFSCAKLVWNLHRTTSKWISRHRDAGDTVVLEHVSTAAAPPCTHSNTWLSCLAAQALWCRASLSSQWSVAV